MWVKYDSILWKIRESDLTTGASSPAISTGAGDPNGVVTPTSAWDEYIDSVTGHKWYAQTTANNTRVEINFMV